MSKKILIDAVYPGDTRVVIYDQGKILDFDFENSHKKQLKGNIYLAKVTRIEPSLQAAFIEYGGDKHGFLPFNEINPSYFMLDDKSVSEASNNGSAIESKIFPIVIPDFTEVEENAPEEEINATEEDGLVLEAELDEDDFEDGDEHKARDLIHHKHKIQDVIKKGQLILIQVIKEERGNKGAACTTYISLAGRYCVLMPNSDRQGGISRRIANPKDRKRLKNILSGLNLADTVSIILRTAGAGKNAADIHRDYYYLARLWNTIREYAIKANANSFIHAESDLLKRTIRDLYSSEISEIEIQGNESFKTAKEFMKKILPLHANKVKEYRYKAPIFTKYGIEEQIAALYNPVVNLPSGGYIVINPTEALIAIDVNSGKATTEKNIEETATKTNLEAAIEIARQLRLRDMSGLIVIDFIDMLEQNNRRLVEKTLHDAFQSDRAKVQLSTISNFGLLELSRQRLQSSFMEANTVICPSCNGKGHIKSFDSNALVVLRTIESEIYKSDCNQINVYAHPEIVVYLLNEKRAQLTRLEELYKCKIIFHKENTVYYDGFALERVEKQNKSSKESAPKITDEDHMEAFGNDPLEEDYAFNEKYLGLGNDLAPLKVNDDMVIAESSSTYNSNRRKSNRRLSSKRKINKPANVDNTTDFNQPALIYQIEDNNKAGVTNKRKSNYKNRRRNRENGNKDQEKKSTLKTWWEKLIE